MRGEYTAGVKTASFSQELPPRARRILVAAHLLLVARGTTSACAENTLSMRAIAAEIGNYLRVRGEYILSVGRRRSPLELPPRARRILENPSNGHAHAGTTSACAENTWMM